MLSTSPSSIPRTFASSQPGTPSPLDNNPTPSLFLRATILLSVWVNPTALGTCYKWNSTAFVFSWLVCFTEYNVFPGGASGQEPACQCWRHKRSRFNPWVGKIPWRARQPTPVFLSRESHGRRSLAGYGLQGHKESDTSESNLAHTYNVFKVHLCCSLCPN